MPRKTKPFRAIRLSEGGVECEAKRVLSEQDILSTAQDILKKRFEKPAPLTNPITTRLYLVSRYAKLEHEVFACVFLDNRYRVIALEEIFRGTVDRVPVYPREVAKEALKHNAAAIIFVHNNPSGHPVPSYDDKALTRKLIDSLALLNIRVLDHFIIDATDTTSFSERGLI